MIETEEVGVDTQKIRLYLPIREAEGTPYVDTSIIERSPATVLDVVKERSFDGQAPMVNIAEFRITHTGTIPVPKE